jgi:hypothetical protein
MVLIEKLEHDSRTWQQVADLIKLCTMCGGGRKFMKVLDGSSSCHEFDTNETYFR